MKNLELAPIGEILEVSLLQWIQARGRLALVLYHCCQVLDTTIPVKIKRQNADETFVLLQSEHFIRNEDRHKLTDIIGPLDAIDIFIDVRDDGEYFGILIVEIQYP